MRIIHHLQQVAAGLDLTGLPGSGDNNADQEHLRKILNLVFVVSGALAVLTIVVAGVRFIISRGNAQEVAKARSAIIFAVGGLVIIVLATVIVNFVIARLG